MKINLLDAEKINFYDFYTKIKGSSIYLEPFIHLFLVFVLLNVYPRHIFWSMDW